MVAAVLAALAAPAFAQEADRPVTLAITLSAEAAALLQEMGEWVTVSAYYFAHDAGPGAPREEDGSVYLGGETLQLYPVDQSVTLAGPRDYPSGWTAAPQINVNVFTSRFAAEDNLIWCDLVEGPVAEIAAAENVIACTLLGQ